MNRDHDPTPGPVNRPLSEASGAGALITPFGGRLVDLVVGDPDERRALLERARDLPAVPLSLRAQYDLEMLAVGAFSPLDRFMSQDEYESVLYEMHLKNGALFPIPLAVPVREDALKKAPAEVALTDEQGAVLALLEVDEVYPHDSLREMRAVLGGRDSAHPLVIEAKHWPSHYVAGQPRAARPAAPPSSHGPMCLTPAEVRTRLTAMGNSNVVAFQTRNPLHRAHEELTRRAICEVGGTLLLHPVVGLTKPGDIDHFTRVRAYMALTNRLLRKEQGSPVPVAPGDATGRASRGALARHHPPQLRCEPSHRRSRSRWPGDSHSWAIPFYGPYDAQALAEL